MITTNIKSSKVFDAISALKEKAEQHEDKKEENEVDLISIVKKISSRRPKTK